MHKTIVAAAAVLLTGAGVCLAQPPGITPEMIERALPARRRAAGGARTVQGHVRTRVRLPRLSRVSPDDAGRVSEEGHLARDGVGQRRLRDRQHALLGLSDHDRLARLPGVGHGASGRRSATQATADDLRAAIDWAEKENERTGSPLEGQDRPGQGRGHGPVVRRISLDRARRRSARQDHRRVQFRRAESAPGAPPSAFPTVRMPCPNCTGPCCSSMAATPTS